MRFRNDLHRRPHLALISTETEMLILIFIFHLDKLIVQLRLTLSFVLII